MAVLTITVDDAQAARVRDAYGVSTNALLRTAIINDIRARVVAYEINKAISDGQPSIQAAKDSVTASSDNAKTSAEAISIS